MGCATQGEKAAIIKELREKGYQLKYLLKGKRSIASTLKKLRTAVIGGSWLLLFSNPFWKFFRPW